MVAISQSSTATIRVTSFGSSSRLYEKSSAALGMTPRVMRERGAGLLIRYATAATPLGRMLVATTAFWLLDQTGVANVAMLCGIFLSGLAVPLVLFPGWTRDVVMVLPWVRRAPEINVFMSLPRRSEPRCL